MLHLAGTIGPQKQRRLVPALNSLDRPGRQVNPGQHKALRPRLAEIDRLRAIQAAPPAALTNHRRPAARAPEKINLRILRKLCEPLHWPVETGRTPQVTLRPVQWSQTTVPREMLSSVSSPASAGHDDPARCADRRQGLYSHDELGGLRFRTRGINVTEPRWTLHSGRAV